MSADATTLAAAMLEGTAALAPARMRAIFEAYLESWRRTDPDGRAALFSDDAVIEDPVGAPAHAGMAAMRAFWAVGDGSGYAFDPRLELFVPGGAECLVRFVLRMTKDGEVPLDFTIHEVLRFDADYRILSLRAFWGAESVTPVLPA